MASSTSTPTIPPPSSSQPQNQTPPTDKYNNTNPIVHTVALGVTPLALIALCLPPRRLDLRATMLGGVALWGTNQLTHDYSGKSFAQRFSSRMALLSGSELPEKAKATQTRLREEKERRAKLRTLQEDMIRSDAVRGVKADGSLEGWTDEQKKALLEAYERQRREEREDGKGAMKGQREEGGKGVLEKIWMGDAAPDWKEKREQKEKEALQEGGGGYWGLIMEQIAEVLSGGKKDEKTGDDAKKS
ncbi:hypothetical protein HD806DRAFT_104389 [Xylariaceae sp. AK1471]|nr:hypothetical protein HD806DRAFT_104389 [Xylariaceae sp. AK1471]